MSNRGFYVLDANGEAVPEPDSAKWGEWFKSANRQLARDEVAGGVMVSTVFLGMDHSLCDPEPTLWETMIFGGPNDEYQERYTTRIDALAGHAKALAIARGEQ